MPHKICQVCGKSFYTERSSSKYCSKACYGISKRGKPNKATIGLIPWNKRPSTFLNCEICGKLFEVPARRKETAKYCSYECQHEAKRRVTGTNHKLWTSVERQCELCGKTVWVKPAKLHEFRFCSRKCVGTYMAKQMSELKGPTSIETAIMNELDNKNISYKPQYIIAVWMVDIAIPDYRIVIECDGDYWHSSEAQKEKDANKDHWLNAHKWTIFRFTETEIKKSACDCINKVIEYIHTLS